MTEKKETGGPAFAKGDYVHRTCDPNEKVVRGHEGMTLRDYFAAKALAAMISQPHKAPENCGKKAVPRLAQFAYEYADAMLAARESQS
ncbi:hypothetical protein [Cupriavidus sp. DL-D2]|uniref:hypothetical protein n=1 Tax=Cupriavidus sp. DL-D2 TaxID=3144974 RepID=UPI0032157370